MRPVQVLKISSFTRRSLLQARVLCIKECKSQSTMPTPKSRYNKPSPIKKTTLSSNMKSTASGGPLYQKGLEPISMSIAWGNLLSYFRLNESSLLQSSLLQAEVSHTRKSEHRKTSPSPKRRINQPIPTQKATSSNISKNSCKQELSWFDEDWNKPKKLRLVKTLPEYYKIFWLSLKQIRLLQAEIYTK